MPLNVHKTSLKIKSYFIFDEILHFRKNYSGYKTGTIFWQGLSDEADQRFGIQSRLPVKGIDSFDIYPPMENSREASISLSKRFSLDSLIAITASHQ